MIKKNALDFFEGTAPAKPAATPAATPSGMAPVAPRTAPAGHVGTGAPAIKEMQEALMNLSKAVTSQINIKDLNPQKNIREQGEASGRNSFNDFITKNYLRNSDVAGVEFDPDPTKNKVTDKKSTTPTRMGVIMDTMNRVGNPSAGENKADGKWGPRTHAALQNAHAFAFAMLKLAKDFTLPIKSYSDAALAKFMLPAKDTDMSESDKETRAPKLTKHILFITKMYEEIKQGILENPQYKAYIETDQPFATFEQAGVKGPVLDQKQWASLQQTFAKGFIVGNWQKGRQIVMPVTALSSLDSFKAWQEKNLPEMPLENILTQVSQALAKQEPSTMAPAPAAYQTDKDKVK